MDRPAGLVRRQGRHVRHQLSRRHPARPGRDEPAPPDHDGPDRRRIELRRERDAAWRCVRAAIHELDLSDRSTQQQGRAGQPGPAAGAGRERSADPPARRQPAGPSGNDSAQGRARVRGVAGRGDEERAGISVLAYEGDVGRRSCQRLCRRSCLACHRLVRLMDAPGHDELRGTREGQEIAAAAGDRPLGARRTELERRGRSRVHAKRPASTSWHSGCGGTTAGCGATRTASTTIRRCCSTSWAPATTARSTAGRLQHGGFWRAEREWPLARTRPTPLYLERRRHALEPSSRARLKPYDLHVRPEASRAHRSAAISRRTRG